MRHLSTTARALQRIESTTTTCAIRSFSSRQSQQQKQSLSSFSPNALRQIQSRTNQTTAAVTPRPNSVPAQIRTLQTTSPSSKNNKPQLAHNNEPIPTEAPQTNFSQMDMLGQTPVPSTAIETCHHDGFTFNSGAVITNGDGAMLIGGEAFAWRPWEIAPLINEKGQFELSKESLAVLEMIWPRPDLLILGMGGQIRPLSVESRRLISRLGLRVDLLDTRNAASQFNLLATERGVDDVVALLVPIGWKP